MKTVPRVDRTSERWQRIRSACGHSASYFDLDQHADHVWWLVESVVTRNGDGHTSGRPELAVPGKDTP